MPKLLPLVAIASVLLPSISAAQTIRLGNEIDVNNVRGAVIAAGASISIEGEIRSGILPTSGVFAAGGSVRIAAAIDGPVFTTGSDISFAGSADNVSAIGASVLVKDTAKIKGDLIAAASTLIVDGEIDGSATLSGAYVELNAQIDEDVTIEAEEIVIGPRAVITGNITYSGDSDPEISPQATIKFEPVRQHPKQSTEKSFDINVKKRAFGALFWFITIAASGVLLISLFPGWFARIDRAGRHHPVSTMILGAVGLLLIPVIAFLFMAIGIGLPVGGFLLTSYLGLLALSFIGACVGVGGLIFSQNGAVGAQLIPFVSAAAILLLLSALPIVGGVVAILTLAFGFGVMTRGFWRTLRDEPA